MKNLHSRSPKCVWCEQRYNMGIRHYLQEGIKGIPLPIPCARLIWRSYLILWGRSFLFLGPRQCIDRGVLSVGYCLPSYLPQKEHELKICYLIGTRPLINSKQQCLNLALLYVPLVTIGSPSRCLSIVSTTFLSIGK